MTARHVLRLALLAGVLTAIVPFASPISLSPPALAATNTTCDGVDVAATSAVDLATFPDLAPDGTNADVNELVLQCIFNHVQPGTTISVPAGASYAHSYDLVLNVPDVTIQGPSTGTSQPIFSSTNVPPSGGETCLDGFPGPCLALSLNGQGDAISNVTIANTHASTRPYLPAEPAGMGLVLGGDSQTVQNVTAFFSDQCGIFAMGATHLRLDHASVSYSGNSGIGVVDGSTGAAGYVTMLSPTIYNSGDDGIAIETHPGSPTNLAHDVWIDHPKYTNTGTPTGGHGIAIVGATNVTVTNFSITGSPSAAIYVADGQVWDDAGSSNVVFNTGTIVNANTSASPPPGQTAVQNGAVLVWSNSATESIDHVLVENVWIVNTDLAADYQVGDFATPSSSRPPTNVEFKNLLFAGNVTNLFAAGSTPSSDYWTINWQAVNADGSVTALWQNIPGALPFTS